MRMTATVCVAANFVRATFPSRLVSGSNLLLLAMQVVW
jgi:hypothetical protein